MLEPVFLPILFFLFILLIVYFWAGRRKIVKKRAFTPLEYLWKLQQITGKSEYELFQIAAEEKGWPSYQVERYFKRYLERPISSGPT